MDADYIVKVIGLGERGKSPPLCKHVRMITAGLSQHVLCRKDHSATDFKAWNI